MAVKAGEARLSRTERDLVIKALGFAVADRHALIEAYAKIDDTGALQVRRENGRLIKGFRKLESRLRAEADNITDRLDED